jgi:threonine dehydrogenase-like Zn-dependent dehydrogenase
MKALRCENNHLSVDNVLAPVSDGEAIVRVTLSGICNTDLEIARGYAGFSGTLGHEFVGVIESLPECGTQDQTARGTQFDKMSKSEHSSATALAPGRRVVGEINAGCGNCDLCRAGDSRHCPERTVLGIVGRDGAHAEFLRLPSINLLPVPDSIPDEHAVFTEPLAAACGILERAEVTEKTVAGVIGDGKLGLLCAQVLAETGASVTLFGKHRNKLQIATRRGIEAVTIDQTKSRTREFDLVVEASGSPSGFQLALGLLRPRGTLVLKSTFHGPAEIDAAAIVVDEISVIGSRCGRFAPALALLDAKQIDVESLISEEFALTDGLRAMECAATSGALKVLLRP